MGYGNSAIFQNINKDSNKKIRDIERQIIDIY